MSRLRTHEQRLLADAAALLEQASAGTSRGCRLDVLEAAASCLGGWDLASYRSRFGRRRQLDGDEARVWGDKLLHLLVDAPVPAPLALAALAEPELDSATRRVAGAYYTDFRLAQHLAAQFPRRYEETERVLDPASGSGMLLAALTLHVSDGDRRCATEFVRRNLCAADMHADALHATRAVLAAAVDDLDAISALDTRLLRGDSLTRSAADWDEIAPGGFAGIISNPPWEKLKVTRHEVLTAAGVDRHYGAEYTAPELAGYSAARRKMLAYAAGLDAQSVLQGKGEADLYKLFLELSARVVGPHGHLGLLLPGGLIRSQGTQPLREFLINHAEDLSVTVFDNRARFFAIDTRFKFLAVFAQLGAATPTTPLRLAHATGTSGGVDVSEAVSIDRAALRILRPDLTVPEVRSAEEWRIFTTITTRGRTLDDPSWRHVYLRELDMTNDRRDFVGSPVEALPLVEGRMVHQHRVRAKAYRSGTGRAAVWEPLPIGSATVAPQFWYPRGKLTPALAARVAAPRAGFCDVTGQTNERTLLAAVVPAGVVCGNKVPTLAFDLEERSVEDAALLWSALANSFVVDWAARRVVTTSMNYFLLRTLPLPALDHADADRVIGWARDLAAAETTAAPDLWSLGTARAGIDALAARRLGLNIEDLTIVLGDFRLLDRGQPPLEGESKSTVTRDVVLAAFAAEVGNDGGVWSGRADRARSVGAIPYVPADYAA